MQIGFDSILEHVIPISKFPLKWRFTDEQYFVMPQIHLEQLKPLDRDASKFLWDYILVSGLHNDDPFKRGLFSVIDEAKIVEGNENDIRKWLYHRGLPFEKYVYLSWQPDTTMVVPWKIFIKYFDEFYYAIADDLTIIDKSLNWALLFHHEHEIYFGSNEKFVPENSFNEMDFIG